MKRALMKYLFSFFIAVFFTVSCTSGDTLYVGTYSSSDSQGIYRYKFDDEKGELNLIDVIPNKENPSFIAFNPDLSVLYAVSEENDGYINSYLLENDSFKHVNKRSTTGKHPCHVTVSPDGKVVVATNYGSGSVSIFNALPDGGLEEVKQVIQHQGSGPDTRRQEGPHAHSSLFTKDGKVLVVADLGTDKLYFYKRSADGSQFIESEAVKLDAGVGPRHFVFSKDQRFIYVLNELASSVSVIENVGGSYKIIETVSGLPSEFQGNSSGADIHLTPDGKFLYSSNRGHNSIAIFSRNSQTGKINFLGTEPVRGSVPRNFVISPNGKFLLVANQRTNNISIFSINKDGLLTYIDNNISVPSPVCLVFK